MKLRRRATKRARIEIIPMIDVIFFLLVFFMISSLSMSRINSIKVALPQTAASPESMAQNVILSVRDSGEIFVNKAMVSLAGVGQALAEAMRDHPQSAVLVNADRGANYGLVVQVMDQARRVGVTKFALSTESSTEAGK